jgi:hypothetical protein
MIGVLFTDPWWDLRADGVQEQRQRQVLHAELMAEIGPDHRLGGLRLSVVARSVAQDDVLVEVEDGTWAVVHLTWRGAPEQPPWPRASLFDSLQDAVDALGTD